MYETNVMSTVTDIFSEDFEKKIHSFNIKYFQPFFVKFLNPRMAFGILIYQAHSLPNVWHNPKLFTPN